MQIMGAGRKFPFKRGRVLEVERVPRDFGEPIRTCVGCRRREPQSALIRVVYQNHARGVVVVVDDNRALPGRGAWLHPNHRCVTRAIKKRALNHAFRIRQPLETEDLMVRYAADMSEKTR